jgi:ankyrin repeat protein
MACKILLDRGLIAGANVRERLKRTIDRSPHFDADELTFLLEHGADVNVTYCCPGYQPIQPGPIVFTSLTALYKAVRDEDGNAVGILIAHGADANLTSYGQTPLILAAEGSDFMVGLLLGAHANVHAKNERTGETALFIAARSGGLESAKLLIAAGADVNAVSEAGETPLMVAVEQAKGQRLGLTTLLLDKGADPNASDRRTESVLTKATRGGYASVITLLRQRGAK